MQRGRAVGPGARAQQARQMGFSSACHVGGGDVKPGGRIMRVSSFLRVRPGPASAVVRPGREDRDQAGSSSRRTHARTVRRCGTPGGQHAVPCRGAGRLGVAAATKGSLIGCGGVVAFCRACAIRVTPGQGWSRCPTAVDIPLLMGDPLLRPPGRPRPGGLSLRLLGATVRPASFLQGLSHWRASPRARTLYLESRTYILGIQFSTG